MPQQRLLLLLVLSLFCTVGNAQEGWPEWLKKENAQEQETLKFQSVTAGEGLYTFEFPGKVGTPESFDGGWYVQASIESEAPIECYIFDEEIDLATLLSNTTDVMIQTTATQYDNAESSRSLYELDAGGYDDTPFMILKMFYLLGEAPEAIAGLSKVRVATKGITSVACSHNTLGYHATFATIFERLITTLTAKEPDLTPYYTELTIQSINDMNIGIIKSTIAMDDEGDSFAVTSTASIFPISASDLSVSDSTSWSWSTPDGNLISVASVDTENGELVNDLQLRRDDDNNWVSSGLFQNKEIEHVIDGDQSPVSEHGSMLKTRELFSSDEQSMQLLSWLPAADPTQLLPVLVERTPEISDKAAKIEMGPISMTGEFDMNGSAERAEMEFGNITLRLERIWSSGEL